MVEVIRNPSPWTRRAIEAGIVFISLSLVCCCSGDMTVPQSAFQLTFGWLIFLESKLPELRFDAIGVVWATIVLVICAAGTHVVAAWVAGTGASGERRWPLRSTMAALFLVALAAVGAMSSAGLISEVGAAATSTEPWYQRPGSMRSASKNNLKQIGLAFHHYHDRESAFPAGGLFHDDGSGRHGWMTLLLPYVDQARLYREIDLSVAWDDPMHVDLMQTEIESYLNPKLRFTQGTVDGRGAAHYAANAHIAGPNRSLRLDEIGSSSLTILAGEIRSQIGPWGAPGNLRDPALGINTIERGFGSPFKGGALLLLADGAVRFVSDTVDPEVLRALSTPDVADNDLISDVDL